MLVVCVFLCEMPFIYILNNIMSQGLKRELVKPIEVDEVAEADISTENIRTTDEVSDDRQQMASEEQSQLTGTIQSLHSSVMETEQYYP